MQEFSLVLRSLKEHGLFSGMGLWPDEEEEEEEEQQEEAFGWSWALVLVCTEELQSIPVLFCGTPNPHSLSSIVRAFCEQKRFPGFASLFFLFFFSLFSLCFCFQGYDSF